MKKPVRFTLKSMTEIKIFLLFLLDNINYPIDYTTLSKILMENVLEMRIDYEEALQSLADAGHLLFDGIDKERYYMISKTGRAVAKELYETIDPEIRENSLRCAAKYMTLSCAGTSCQSTIEQTPDGKFRVNLRAKDESGEFFSLSLTFASRKRAEALRDKFDSDPERLYRSIMFCATGEFEFLN